MAPRYATTRRRRRSCLGCLGRLALWLLLLVGLTIAGVWLSFTLAPPFGTARVAKVLVAGLDDLPRGGGARRADTILLAAVRLDGSGSLLLSVPRDARVRLPGRTSRTKINAAYAFGGIELLRDTVNAPRLLDAGVDSYLVLDSDTVRAVVDALGGITVNVTSAMHYDDSWGNLSIHLEPGVQKLSGRQAVGYLRWRKNKGRPTPVAASGDFARAERQRALLTAISQQLASPSGVLRLPAVYQAFRRTTTTNLTVRQLLLLALTLRHPHSAALPATPFTLHGVSYVECDWGAGRAVWGEGTR